MLFEVFNLQHASPATMSCCGMISPDQKNLGFKTFLRQLGERQASKILLSDGREDERALSQACDNS